MKIKSLGLKVSLIVALMFTVIIVFIVLIVYAQSTRLIDDLTTKEAAAANVSFKKEIQALQDEALLIARIIAYSSIVADAVASRDEDALNAALAYYHDETDTLTVCDAEGNILAHAHDGASSGNIYNEDTVSETLTTGTGMGVLMHNADGFATRGSSAIKNADGKIIGAVICGHDLSNPAYIDAVKEVTGSEVTIFNGDTRYMTTIINESGNRVVGTPATNEVVETVLVKQNDYSLQIPLFGQMYHAHYTPLIIKGEVTGMLFTGIPIDDTLSGQRSMMMWVILSGVLCGVVCIIAVMIFNT